MPADDANKDNGLDALSDLARGPLVTMLVLFLTLVGAAVLIIGEDELTFETWLNTSLLAVGGLGIARGLAYKNGDPELPFSRFDRIPWTMVMLFVYSAVGAIVMVFGDASLSYEEYMRIVLQGAIGLGLGKGIAALKRDHNLIDIDHFELPEEGSEEYAKLAAEVESSPVDEGDKPVSGLTGKGGEV